MSTAIPAATTVPLSKTDTAAPAAMPADLDAAGTDAATPGFSALFSDVMEDAVPDDSAQTPLPDTPDPTATITPAAVSDGNTLPPYMPFVAWSGTVAVGDDQGATALAMDGDNTSVAIGKPVTAGNIPTAIQTAMQQQQLQQQQQTVMNMATTDADASMPNWWNKLDNSPTALTPTVLANMGIDPTQAGANTSDTNSLMALAAATASASPATSNPALSYVQNARYDQPLGSIPLPVTHPDWGNQLGEGVRWMAQQNIQTADLRLTPPDLGLLEVRINMNADQANVTFSSPHAAVRNAIEHALPQLRDMLGNTGIQLGDVNVSQQSLSQHQSHAENFANSQSGNNQSASGEQTNAIETEIPAIQLPRRGQGLVDMYA